MGVILVPALYQYTFSSWNFDHARHSHITHTVVNLVVGQVEVININVRLKSVDRSYSPIEVPP
jgi:hypothetical protein